MFTLEYAMHIFKIWIIIIIYISVRILWSVWANSQSVEDKIVKYGDITLTMLLYKLISRDLSPHIGCWSRKTACDDGEPVRNLQQLLWQPCHVYKVTSWSTDNPELVESKYNGHVNAFNACKPLSLRDASIEIYRMRMRIRDSVPPCKLINICICRWE